MRRGILTRASFKTRLRLFLTGRTGCGRNASDGFETNSKTIVACCLAILVCLAATGRADEQDEEQQRRSTAVALNYCRASFHRITRYPVKPVLIEEQEKILNNLNLNGISDEEVVRLYSELLMEIGEVQIADRDRKVVRDRYNRALQEQIAVGGFALGTELATAQYVSAVRTGARSWWDYRTVALQRDLDAWRIEKERMLSLTAKSVHLLDTFWKLARKRSIPDRWLIRSTDLDKLEDAVREPDAEVRLRVLKRMEPFMEYYPPYWYYMARTEQALGRLFAASQTYAKLAEFADGNFRKDDMLAAGLANRAMIQEHLGQPGAVATAQQALTYSTEVWEVNLLCAYVLARHNVFADAEDAILRNLDVDLERQESTTALLTVYCQANEPGKLAARLKSREVVQNVPVPLLLRCAALLGTERLPDVAAEQITASLYGRFDLNFGPDDVVFVAAPNWELQRARVTLRVGDREYRPSRRFASKDGLTVKFRKVMDTGSPLGSGAEAFPAALVLKYAEHPEIRLQLHRLRETTIPLWGTVNVAGGSDERYWSPLAVRRDLLQIRSMEFGDAQLAFLMAGADINSRLPDSDLVREIQQGREELSSDTFSGISENEPSDERKKDESPTKAVKAPLPVILEPVPVTPPAGTQIE